MAYTAVELIELKRDGKRLPIDGIEWLIAAYTDGSVPDYQMAAMAMAIVFNGLESEELASWTTAMLESGETLDFSDIPVPKVDKHSTGGVGDKISIPLAPLVASCGVAVPMMSGRGLAHTGGTLDKLESIPGFEPRLDQTDFRRILTEHRLVLAGQSDTMVPADRKLYALRDSTGTVPSVPLISSSIMSKKLSEGLDGLVLDVKTGSGAFMEHLDEARELARTMVGIGVETGVETVALITSMDQPLGYEVGNANEIRESVQVLEGNGPKDISELTFALGEVMLELAGVDGGRERLGDAIESGAALQKLKDVVVAHGGDASVLEETSRLEQGRHEGVIEASGAGYVIRCDALTIGIAATRLGAGRERKEDDIDHGVGVSLRAKMGDRVETGDPLAVVHFNDEGRWSSQRDRLASAWDVGPEPPAMRDLVLERIDRAQI
ncbi:MAG TPA: thymidine phosphorylase [Acidimicrobiia bacterium]|nr:thymidine phosphorylase [Acidimicrobiia bacterium]